MLETFINLASVVSEDATITEATLFATGHISIDGVTASGERFHLVYREEREQKHADP